MAVKKKLSIPKSASHGIQRTFLGDSTARTAINKPTAEVKPIELEEVALENQSHNGMTKEIKKSV